MFGGKFNLKNLLSVRATSPCLAEKTRNSSLPRIYETLCINTMSESVRACHILTKHTESRNPVSRRTGAKIVLSKQDAEKELSGIRLKLQEIGSSQGQQSLYDNFCKIAKGRSDCGSFREGGDLGSFTRGMMQKPFEDATFGLNVGEMSEIVDTDSGLHIIFRTE